MAWPRTGAPLGFLPPPPATSGSMAIGGAITSATAGSVLFSDGSSQLGEDNAAFQFDATNNQLLLGLGAVGNPAYSFVGDVNTGIYSPAADQMAVALGGVLNVSLGVAAGSTPDLDLVVGMGRTLIDARITDNMVLSHRDQSTTTQYAIKQTAAGITTVSGQTVNLARATVNRIVLDSTGIGFFSATPVAQQTVGAVTNSVTAGGVDGTIANYTDLTTYANDSAAIRNDLYQLARSVAQLATAVRNLGLAA